MEPWVVVLTSSVAGSIVTLIWQHVSRVTAEDDRRRSAKAAIRAEVEHAARAALGYLEPDAITSPGGRLSTALYAQGMPVLLSLSAITGDSAGALLDFYGHIDAFNRSLDATSELRSDNKVDFAVREVIRARLKAMALVSFRDLQAMALDEKQQAGMRALVREKLEKYDGGRTPYDRAVAALGLI